MQQSGWKREWVSVSWYPWVKPWVNTCTVRHWLGSAEHWADSSRMCLYFDEKRHVCLCLGCPSLTQMYKLQEYLRLRLLAPFLRVMCLSMLPADFIHVRACVVTHWVSLQFNYFFPSQITWSPFVNWKQLLFFLDALWWGDLLTTCCDVFGL